MSDKVSIIMPTYNSSKFISKAIDSVIAQSYQNWELLVVDDCSTDDTYSIIKAYTECDPRIILLQTDYNVGAAGARNKALKNATGRYIAFLDSDDVWFAQKLEHQIAFMKINNYAFSCTAYNKIDEKDNDLNFIVPSINVDYNGMLKRCPGNSTVIYDSQVIGAQQVPLIKRRNDYVLWLQIIKIVKEIYGLDEVLSSHRVREKSLSSSKVKLLKYQWTVYRIIEKQPFVKSIYLVVYQIFKSLFKIK